MRRTRRLLPVLVLTLAATGCAGTPSESTPTTPLPSPDAASFGALPVDQLDDATSAKLQSVLDAVVEDGMPDAIATVVTSAGRWSGAAGVDGPDSRAAKPDDVFSIASITKVFAAALVMRLCEEGKLALDEPLSTYLPDVDVDTNGATVEQALQMLSGIPDTREDSIAKVTADPSHVWTQAQIVAEIPGPVSDAGSEYIYSNPTYKLLGYAAESVTGQPLAGAMRQLVLDPAGSPETLVVQSAELPLPEPWALPMSGTNAPLESFGVGSALPNISDATFAGAGTGMAGTAPGVADWAWRLFAGEVISPASLQTMMTTTDADGSGTGLDELVSQNLKGAYGHTGSKDGYQSLLAVFPDDQTVIVVFINERDAPVDAVVSSLKAALDE